ncbi:DUF305 domain-containing protein [Dactylosporangium matsuzakiense]|uniref:DUF305 domain-containing protein n=1 Tax=Dactylosporangium matsuzakiense TaxID=53360 RepID=UPI0021C293FA|nr:DUF305 domain-containing protein [Dactylosporangium matsuzakiense]
MIGSAHVRPGRTARLMLLLATLFGLAAMHTNGSAFLSPRCRCCAYRTPRATPASGRRRAVDAEVKTLAGQIKAAQDPEIQTMTGWLYTWGRPAPAMSGMDMGGMGHAMPGMMSDADLAKLEAATGKDFDKQFCTMMIAHHQGAIAMAQDEIKQGGNPDAKALAQRIVTAQQAEIDTMNTILARL